MNARQIVILDMLRDGRPVLMRELARRFDVSDMTVRRDFALLERQGLLVRTHGGAVSAGKLRFLQHAIPNYEVSPLKAAIGEAAAGLVLPGQTVMIDTGTTAMEVARHLRQDAEITVLTTSLCVAQELYGSPIRLLLLGGFLRQEFPSTYGPLTESTIEQLHADMLFMGCDGANCEDGFYSADLHIASQEQAMIKVAERVVVVAASRKFQRRALSRYARVPEVHAVVTDTALPEDDRRRLEEQGVGVILVEQQSFQREGER